MEQGTRGGRNASHCGSDLAVVRWDSPSDPGGRRGSACGSDVERRVVGGEEGERRDSAAASSPHSPDDCNKSCNKQANLCL